MSMSNGLKIRELLGDGELTGSLELISVLRPHLLAGEFLSQIRAQQSEGYHLMGGFVDQRLVVLAGFRYSLTLSRGRHLFVDDLVTDPAQQGKGYATAMLKHLAKLARETSLSKIWLDSRDTARTFYEKVGFKVHTSMPCMIEVSQLE